jgi:hypothetical protein
MQKVVQEKSHVSFVSSDGVRSNLTGPLRFAISQRRGSGILRFEYEALNVGTNFASESDLGIHRQFGCSWTGFNLSRHSSSGFLGDRWTNV